MAHSEKKHFTARKNDFILETLLPLRKVTFYIIPLEQLFLPEILWSLLLDINGMFLHHTRGWTFFLHTMVVITGAQNELMILQCLQIRFEKLGARKIRENEELRCRTRFSSS